MKRIEWNTDTLQWVWRIYKEGRRTSAYVPFNGTIPDGMSEAEYESALEVMELEDSIAF